MSEWLQSSKQRWYFESPLLFVSAIECWTRRVDSCFCVVWLHVVFVWSPFGPSIPLCLRSKHIQSPSKYVSCLMFSSANLVNCTSLNIYQLELLSILGYNSGVLYELLPNRVFNIGSGIGSITRENRTHWYSCLVSTGFEMLPVYLSISSNFRKWQKNIAACRWRQATLGSRGYFFLIDISRRSRVDEAQSNEGKKITSGHRSTQPHFHARNQFRNWTGSPIGYSHVKLFDVANQGHCYIVNSLRTWEYPIGEPVQFLNWFLAWKWGCVLLWPEVIFFSSPRRFAPR